MHPIEHLTTAIHEYDYLARFGAELCRRLRRRNVRDADDIAQTEVERVKRRLNEVTSRYPNPEIYARVRLTAAVSDHFRREKVQRGHGAKATINDEGQLAHGREVISGDAPIPLPGSDGTIWETLPDADGDWVGNLNDQLKAAALLRYLSPQDAEIVYLSLGLEYSDAEIANRLGCARETVNRRKLRAVRRIRGGLGPDKV